jgi:hypothetical protein
MVIDNNCLIAILKAAWLDQSSSEQRIDVVWSPRAVNLGLDEFPVTSFASPFRDPNTNQHYVIDVYWETVRNEPYAAGHSIDTRPAKCSNQ